MAGLHYPVDARPADAQRLGDLGGARPYTGISGTRRRHLEGGANVASSTADQNKGPTFRRAAFFISVAPGFFDPGCSVALTSIVAIDCHLHE